MKHGVIILGFIILSITAALLPTSTQALKYGSGSYGSCQYNTCNISLSSGGSVAANVTPNGLSATCSIASDSVTVTTGATTGYTLTLGDSDTVNTLASSNGSSIAAASGTSASPAVLANNTWGYRVDSYGSFGAGPTSAVSNSGIPSFTFAAIPLSSATADTIATQTSAASSGVTTSVWYGVCADTTKPNGSYTDSVTYTAVTN